MQHLKKFSNFNENKKDLVEWKEEVIYELEKLL